MKTTTNPFDLATRQHMERWIDSQTRSMAEFDAVEEAFLNYLRGLDESDLAHALDCGWRFVWNACDADSVISELNS